MRTSKTRTSLKHLTLDRKVQLMLVLAIGISTLLIIIVTTQSALKNISQKSSELVQENASSKAVNIGSILATYESSLRSLDVNDSVQNYVINKGGKYSWNASAVYNTMINTLNSTENIWGLTLVRDGDKSYVNFSPRSSWNSGHFVQAVEENFESSVALKKGALTYNIGKKIGVDGTTFNLYLPVYNYYNIGQRIGLLCLRIDTDVVRDWVTAGDSVVRSRLLSTDGRIIVSASEDEYLKPYSSASRINGDSGMFRTGENLVVYQKVSGRNLYLVEELPLRHYYEDTYQAAFILVFASILIMLTVILISGKMISAFFQPMYKLREGMHRVSGGDLSVRIREEGYGDDIRELISGFNGMTERIEEQMHEIVEKEHEARKNEIEALQESIKPHFLYNTLECIHWQTVADGNQKASRMVQALAKYYRISLDRGDELISMALELKHVESYITVQNMRFNDTIDFRNNIPETLYGVKIPKITLQPLVENAIYHGIHAEKEKSGWIRLEAVSENGNAVIRVIDSGHEMNESRIAEINRKLSANDRTLGYGVRNVHRRLQLAFGENCGLHYRLTETGGTEVDITVPGGNAAAQAGDTEQTNV